MDIEPGWLWMILAVALAAAELALPGVYLIWFAAAAAVAGLTTLIFEPSVTAQFLVFAAGAVVAVIAGRSWYVANPIESSDPLLNDRVARLIGRVVTVETAIAGGEGRVQVGDGAWSARGPDAPVGARMRVVGVEDGVLIVEAEPALPPA
ncbi:NfeD family protein [Sphingomonas flavalba]|uniref:NfeD family protein n=1 Tax=Sphingomonas flavalba TaxID=2559804 RepID=UPI00109DDF80|nr:NfeD family protein [Sphingomonas flavalba]